ncbi:hypothetical protein TTRE_0000027401 [Trichuris trichiura]|uniref:Uncharacterized protein n=1 Tax=Trichuris trichiura TaxID=36087 RepID=A0A077Z069_TRITR|nr:hypothetical protein TTRE_0000027401 [Trichuris trichiura]
MNDDTATSDVDGETNGAEGDDPPFHSSECNFCRAVNASQRDGGVTGVFCGASLTVSTEGRQAEELRDADTTNVGTLSWKNVLRAICKPQFCPEAMSSNRRVPGTANSWSEAVALLGHGYTRWPFGID